MAEGTVILACNHRCGATRQSAPGESIEQLRRRLLDVGWLCDSAIDLDLCPTHVDDVDAYYEDAFK